MSWDSSIGWIPQSPEIYLNNYYEAFKNANPEYANLTRDQFNDSHEFEVSYMSAQIDASISSLFGEVMQRISTYIRDENLKISNPTTTPNAIMVGIWENFGYRSSVKEMTEPDSGKLHLAIDYTSTPEEDFLIGQWLEKTSVVASTWMVGDIEQFIVLSDNTGSETYRWTQGKETPLYFRTTIKISRNTNAVVDPPEIVQDKFFANWNQFYWIGRDIEPEKYLEINRDCPYAADIKTEWSTDQTNWNDQPFKAEYDSKYMAEMPIANITITYY